MEENIIEIDDSTSDIYWTIYCVCRLEKNKADYLRKNCWMD